MEAKLDMVLEQVGRDKNIDKTVLINALEQAILTAAKRTFGLNREMEAKFNGATGSVDLFLSVNVVDDDAIEGREITVEDAHKAGLEAELGDELLFQVFYRAEDDERAREQDEKFGLLIDLRNASKKFGRIAAQTAKQVIYQRVREAERDNVYNEFKDRKGEIISGIVRRFERGALIVDIGKAEAVLPMREQVPRESYRVGDSIKAYCLDIDRNARGPQVILSRTHKGLLEKLFEQEEPEIYEKIVRIESSAREPGARAKIAVSSRDRDVDPVGACVGMKGSRVQAVVQELRGEKIDIVPYSEDPARFVCNAIAPAEVSRVVIDAETHTMELIVPDDKLSLAIGKKGQNVRLASQLTGWKIDIHSETKVRELEEQAKKSLAEIEGSSDELAATLFKLGWRSAKDVAEAAPEVLAQIPGIDVSRIPAMQEAAKTQAVDDAAELARMDYEREQARLVEARRHPDELSQKERLVRVRGINEKLIEQLATAGYNTVEELANEKDIARLGDVPGVGIKKARQIKSAAEGYLLEEAKLRAELNAERAMMVSQSGEAASSEEAKI